MNDTRKLIITILACAVIAAIGGYFLGGGNAYAGGGAPDGGILTGGGVPYVGGTEAIVAIDFSDDREISHYMVSEAKADMIVPTLIEHQSFSGKCASLGLHLAGTWGFTTERLTKNWGAVSKVWLCGGKGALIKARPDMAPALCELSGRDLVGIRDDVITCGPMGLKSA